MAGTVVVDVVVGATVVDDIEEEVVDDVAGTGVVGALTTDWMVDAVVLVDDGVGAEEAVVVRVPRLRFRPAPATVAEP